MKTSRRAQRFASLIKQHASTLVQFEFDDFSSLFVTITDVSVTSDLRNVKIFYSVLGGEKEKKEAAVLFRRCASRFRYELGKRIAFRFVPEFFFEYDKTSEQAERIEFLLKQK